MKSIVFLTGGLGNQLFQTANALKKTNGGFKNVSFETKAGQPRVNQFGQPEVYDYINFTPIESNLKTNKFSRKVYRLNLLLSTKKLSRTELIFKKMVTIVSSAVISLLNREIILIFSGNGIGFDDNRNPSVNRFSKLFIGYFQSYLYSNEAQVKFLFKIQDASQALQVSAITEKLKIYDKVIMHVRRGDYLQERDFGVLGIEYYSHAISHFTSLGFRQFLVFSDEPEIAKELFTSFKGIDIQFFEEHDLSSSQILEIMTHGVGLIIANSTFSWWAGYLRKDSLATVVAPNKWFAHKSDPNMLLPSEWVRI
jgi:hypothetical protein